MAALQQLLDCRISSWYPDFARVTFKTVLLPLPQPVVDWLVSDGLHLAPDSQAFAKRGQLEEYPDEDDYQDWQSEDEEGGSGSEGSGAAAAQPPPPELAALVEQLRAAIEELGGRVLPKLTWSCPKDAVWMSPSSSLCCTNPDEVLLLLRASDRVAHDICHALREAAAAGGDDGDAAGPGAAEPATGAAAAAAAEAEEAEAAAAAAAAAATAGAAPVQHVLALRRWYDLQPGREFRCFVRGQALVGASQRDVTQCFEFLKEERAELAAALQAFHGKHIRGRFPHPHYTYDVYIAASGAVRLLDFNPVGGTTAPLLFSWQELGLGREAAAAGEAAAEAAEAAAGEAGAAGPGSAAAGGAGSAAAAGGGAAAEPCGHCSCGGQAAEAAAGELKGAAAAEQGGAAEGAAGPSYLKQLRRVQALSLADQQPQPQQQPQQQQASSSALEPIAAAAAAGAAAAVPAPGQAPAQPPAAAFELRILEEPVALRPHALAYGVPFDFVDASEGSALDRLMAQAGAQGAGELWAALAAGRGGGGGSG